MSDLVIKHREAQRLADLAGVLGDLTLTMRTCDLFLGSPNVGSDEAILRSKALASFAIITYFRTVAQNCRTGVTSEQISRLAPHQQAAHQKFKAIRDHSR